MTLLLSLFSNFLFIKELMCSRYICTIEDWEKDIFPVFNTVFYITIKQWMVWIFFAEATYFNLLIAGYNVDRDAQLTFHCYCYLLSCYILRIFYFLTRERIKTITRRPEISLLIFCLCFSYLLPFYDNKNYLKKPA